MLFIESDNVVDAVEETLEGMKRTIFLAERKGESFVMVSQTGIQFSPTARPITTDTHSSSLNPLISDRKYCSLKTK